MANRRDTFAKRQREADLKEKARAKLARRMAKRTEVRTTKGPEMAGVDEVQFIISGGASPMVSPGSPVAATDADPADPPE
jgi:hypothetical protein